MTQHTRGRTARRGMSVWKLVVAVAAVVLAGLGWVAIAGQDNGKARAPSLEMTTATVRSFTITTLANGELAAKNQYEIRNKVESRTSIVEIIPEGTMAKAGDVLIRLADEDLRNRIAEEELAVIQARTELENAEAAEKIQVSENESKLRAAESTLAIATLTFEQWERGDVLKQRQQLKLEVEKAEKNFDRLSSKYENSKRLYEADFLSKDELDRDEIDFIQARAAVQTARLDLDVYEEYQYHKDAEERRRAVEEATAELERVLQENEINLRSRQTQTANRRRQLALREDKLNELLEQLKYCTVVAPRDGLVVYGSSVQSDMRRWMNEGGLAVGVEVGNNDLLIALPDTAEMTASVKVHESIAGRVRPGQTATVKVEAIDQTISGVVASVGVLAESGGWRDPNRREYTVKIHLDTETARGMNLKPTLRCEARIELGRVENALAVPVQAVFNDGPVRYVLRSLPTGRFERVPVMLGRTSDTDAEILRGLSAGDRVLLREPTAGEIENPTEWDPERLGVAGYTLDENGKPIIDLNALRGGMPGAAPAGGPAGPGAPAGDQATPADQSAPAAGDRRPRNGGGQGGGERPRGGPGGRTQTGG